MNKKDKTETGKTAATVRIPKFKVKDQDAFNRLHPQLLKGAEVDTEKMLSAITNGQIITDPAIEIWWENTTPDRA